MLKDRVTGEEISYSKYAGHSTNSEYVYFDRGTGLWYDGSSDMSCYMVVELDNYKIYKDTDSDGLPDYMEIQGMRASNGRTYYTDMRNADTDGDGLSDSEEMGTPRVFSASNNGIRVVKATVNLINRPRNLMFMMNSSPNEVDSDGDIVPDNHDLHPFIKAYMCDQFSLTDDCYGSVDYVDSFISSWRCDSEGDSSGTQEPTSRDIKNYSDLYLYALMSSAMLPEASDALLHFLEGTGTPFILDVDSIVRVPEYDDMLVFTSDSVLSEYYEIYFGTSGFSSIATKYYFDYLENIIPFGVSVLKDGDELSFVHKPLENDRFIAFSFDDENYMRFQNMRDYCLVPFLGMGGSSAGIATTISRELNNYSITYRYIIYDAYDWEIAASYLPFLPTDLEVGHLEEVGLAKEFIVYGESTHEYLLSIDGEYFEIVRIS